MSITQRDVQVEGGSFRVRESGPADAPAVVLLHGWPEDATCWDGVQERLQDGVHCVAADLPGIGGSVFAQPRGDKRWLADRVHDLVTALGLERVTLVGQDAGGMTAYAYLRAYADELRAAAILNTAVPGVAPWDEVLANPYVWHFAFHSIPDLPERLVRHETAAYFDFFFDALKGRGDGVPMEARERYVAPHRDPAALSQGFAFYRAFRQDVEDNSADRPPVDVPVLYVRGTEERVDVAAYVAGFAAAGLRQVESALVDGAGHYAADEEPDGVAEVIAGLVDRAR